MDRRYLGFLLGFAAVHATAQTTGGITQGATSSSAPSSSPGSTPLLAGTYTADLIQLSDSGPSIPLRHGNVLSGSEIVELNGLTLKRDTDYSMDYAGGVVYLMKVTKPGDSLHVSYRFTNTATAQSPSGNALSGFKFDLMPGALNMQMGFGVAERGANGQIMRSNVFGWNNNFTMRGGSAGLFQGGGLTGLLVVDDHQTMTARSNFESAASSNGGAQTKGQSNLILQNFTSGLLGGHFNANYQDVSKDFAAFGNASGVDQSVLTQLQKEKGLKRTSFGLQDVSVLGLKLTDDYRTVKDPTTGGISWRDLGMKQGNFNFAWNQQKVDSNFTRFDDLSEANKADLKRGLGLDRETMALGFGLGKTPAMGALNFQGLTIGDPSGGHIYKRDLSLASKNLTFDFGDQQVQQKFASFGNLADAEKPIYQLDGGLHRQWASFSSNFGHGYTPLNFSEKWISSDTGEFIASDAGFGGKGWALVHSERTASMGFNSFGSINAADTDASINAIAAMYGPTAPNGQANKVNAPAERGLFAGLAGFQRRYDAASFNPAKDLTVSVGQLDLRGSAGAGDDGSLDTLSIASKKYTVNYRNQNLGENFTQLPQMLAIERQNLGTIQGLKRTDLGVMADLGKGSSLTFNLLDANAGLGAGLGAASRQVLDLKEKTFEISYNHRDVDNNFTRVNELVDPENNTLATLVGHNESDLKFKGTVTKGLSVDGQFYDDTDAVLFQKTTKNNLNVNYANTQTTVAFSHVDQHSNDPLQLLLSQVSDSFSLSQKFGSSLKLHVTESDASYAGTQAASSTGVAMVDSHSRTVGMEYQINKNTNVASEFTDTLYGNGERSFIRNDSVSRTISKRAGVTLSESVIDNPSGQLNTQTKRNYGFWYDLGKGMVFNYGYVRQLDTAGFATLNSMVSLGQAPNGTAKPDQLGALPTSTLDNLSFAGGYAANQWETPTVNGTTTTEAMRTQSFSNIRVSTAKPMKIGQISDFKFNFSLDTAADNYNWIRENRAVGFSGKYGMTGFGFDYKSQMDTVGDRAVDRAFSFTTDTSAKKFISASVNYKVRTLPDSVKSLVLDQNVMIRNYDVTIRPTDKLSLSTQLLTNPEVTNAGAMLGSLTQGTRVNRWKLNYASTATTDLGASYEDNINDSSKAIGQTLGFNMTLFKNTSPIKFFYGYENILGNVPQHSTERWSFEFDQRPGANQSFNIFVGNVSYGYTLAQGQSAHNLTMRVDYIWKF